MRSLLMGSRVDVGAIAAKVGEAGVKRLHRRALAGDAGCSLRPGKDESACRRVLERQPFEVLAVIERPDLWGRWLEKLRAKGYFEGAPPGSRDHADRTERAMRRFADRFGRRSSGEPTYEDEAAVRSAILHQPMSSSSSKSSSSSLPAPAGKDEPTTHHSLPPSLRAAIRQQRPLPESLFTLIDLD